MNRNYFRPFLFIFVLLVVYFHYSSAFYDDNDKNDEDETEIASSDADHQSFYEVLDVTRRSTENMIRRAFKKSAIWMHPDKHRNEETDTKKLRRLQLAFEVLLDSNMRQIYDENGEEAVEQFITQHHRSPPSFVDDGESEGQSGLYDEDAAITKFDDASFRALVLGGGGGKKWFVNFYHTDCEPCHEMVDEWRRFARQMDGVIGVGAVNCKEHVTLCSDMNIGLYPGLIVFPEGGAYVDEERTSEKFIAFVLSVINPSGYDIGDAILEPGKSYLIDACDDTSGYPVNCLLNDTLKLLALRLFASGSSVRVKSVSFHWKPELRRLFKDGADGLYYSEAFGTDGFEKRIESSDVDEIIAFIGKQAPDFVDLVWPKMLQLIERGRIGTDVSQWMVIFEDGASKVNQDYHELRFLIGGHSLKIGRFNCEESPSVCERFPSVYLEAFPAFAIFRPNLGYEFFKGASYTTGDVAIWAAGVSANNFKTLDGDNLIEIVFNRSSDGILKSLITFGGIALAFGIGLGIVFLRRSMKPRGTIRLMLVVIFAIIIQLSASFPTSNDASSTTIEPLDDDGENRALQRDKPDSTSSPSKFNAIEISGIVFGICMLLMIDIGLLFVAVILARRLRPPLPVKTTAPSTENQTPWPNVTPIANSQIVPAGPIIVRVSYAPVYGLIDSMTAIDLARARDCRGNRLINYLAVVREIETAFHTPDKFGDLYVFEYNQMDHLGNDSWFIEVVIADIFVGFSSELGRVVPRDNHHWLVRTIDRNEPRIAGPIGEAIGAALTLRDGDGGG